MHKQLEFSLYLLSLKPESLTLFLLPLCNAAVIMRKTVYETTVHYSSM